ncbi:MAG: hypothetical protein ACP5P4_08800 [Steroidobacteraceae bacterium]
MRSSGASDQRAALDMLREHWWLNIEENAKASGAWSRHYQE